MCKGSAIKLFTFVNKKGPLLSGPLFRGVKKYRQLQMSAIIKNIRITAITDDGYSLFVLILLILLCQGHGKEELAAFTRLALRPDTPSMSLYQMAGNSQPQARATTGTRAIYLIKALEDAR